MAEIKVHPHATVLLPHGGVNALLRYALGCLEAGATLPGPRWSPPDETRVVVAVDDDLLARMRALLLFADEHIGVGYSEFMVRARAL